MKIKDLLYILPGVLMLIVVYVGYFFPRDNVSSAKLGAQIIIILSVAVFVIVIALMARKKLLTLGKKCYQNAKLTTANFKLFLRKSALRRKAIITINIIAVIIAIIGIVTASSQLQILKPKLIEVGISSINEPWPPQSYMQLEQGDLINAWFTIDYSGPNIIVRLKTRVLDSDGKEVGNQVTGPYFSIFKPFENPIRGVGIEYQLSDNITQGKYYVEFSIWDEDNTQQYDMMRIPGILVIKQATSLPLSITGLTPSAISTNSAPYDVTLSISGTNFENVDQVIWTWSGATSGSSTWNKDDSNWNNKVVIKNDSLMTLIPTVVDIDPTWSGITDWTVTLRDTTGTTASRSFTVTYAPFSSPELEVYTPPLTSLVFTSLTPQSITTSESTYDAVLTATGSNFNYVNQVTLSWIGPDSGSVIWNEGDSNWNRKVTIHSDTLMILQPRILYNESIIRSETWTWTVTIRDNSGTSVSKTFIVNYTP